MDMTTCNHPAEKITVIIPMYNAAAFLKATLNSVLVQTFGNFKLLLIDDCSTDQTAEIARSYSDPRMLVVQNETNQGAGATRNKGIEYAQTTYIAFCDADDIMSPHRLEEQFNFMELHPDIDICGSFVKIIDKNGNSQGKYTFPTTHDEIAVAMFLRCAFMQSTAFIRTATLKQSGLLYKENHYAEDFDLWTRAVKQLKFHTLPRFLMYYTLSDSQLSAASHEKQQKDAFLTYARMMKELGVKYNDAIIAVHYEIAHRINETISAAWLQEYETFCHECLRKNRERKIYKEALWQRAIIHHYKKSQCLIHNKIIATLKTLFFVINHKN
ncbi:MAG: glycosyltransferase family A protein [Bacteroides sp.]